MSFLPTLRRQRIDREPRGQILVIVAAGLVVIVAMTGLVVDGGYAWGQQRDTQNGADAASEAGAVVLAERLAGSARLDSDVSAAVDASVTANGVSRVGAWYTDIAGNLIDDLGAMVGSTADAAVVGGGAIPTNGAGVQAQTSKNFDTFLVRIIGMRTLTAVADATAVAGYVEGVCPATGDCAVLPVTIPLNIVTCAGNGEVVPSNPAAEWPWYYVHLTVPLCKNNPGNVGWLDWTPPGGGTSELITAIGPPGTNKQMDVPSWQYITSTGNVNSKGVEDALNYYAINQIPVLIPMFDTTCNATPVIDGSGNEVCPAGHTGGNGVNQWYHIARFVSFLFDDPKGAYVNGNNKPACDTGNGATSCLKGQFIGFVWPGGTVGAGPGWQGGANAAVGIQLIK